MRRDITFSSQGSDCSGWLYTPDDLAEGTRAPAIVMANAMSAVKEITLPLYAERFAAAGYAAVAFDYRRFGSSGGEPRNHLDPHDQLQDVRNALTWLRAQPEVDPERVGAWGVSIGGVHVLNVAAYDRRVKAVVSVATGFNVAEQMLGREGMHGVLAQINADRDRRFLTGEAATYMPAVSMPGGGGLMAFPEANDFYLGAKATYAPAYDNRLTLESMEWLAADHSTESLPLISPTPMLLVHGERDVIPVSAIQAIYDRCDEPKSLLVLDCLHTDLYVREPWVTQSSDAAIEWFGTHLAKA